MIHIEMVNRTGGCTEGTLFVTNEEGKRVAVIIDLQKYGELWEDFYDSLTARKRSNEPRETLDSVKKHLIKEGKLGDCLCHQSCALSQKRPIISGLGNRQAYFSQD